MKNKQQHQALRKAAFQRLLPSRFMPVMHEAESIAPVNIALIKYWGKRDSALNLPITDSISIALQKYTTTKITQAAPSMKADCVILDGTEVSHETSFYIKLTEFLSHVRPDPSFYFHIATINDVPTGAGLASSASGFCALAKALNQYFDWKLSLEEISRLARLGSGSACRSVHSGLVQWKQGELSSGDDSYAVSLPYTLPELCLGIVFISKEEKPISSRDAMEQTVQTSPLYSAWPMTVSRHIAEMEVLLQNDQVHGIDFHRFGALCEQNALAMHATMAASLPPILYWTQETVRVIKSIFQFRKEERDIPLYFTMDAGPNIKLIFRRHDREKIQRLFPDLEIVEPLWH